MKWLLLLLTLNAHAITVYRVAPSSDGTTNTSALLMAQVLDVEALVQLGKIPGVSIINKMGRNPDVDTATVPEDLWNGGGAYTGFPLTAQTVHCFSSSASDTAAGTGARTILIQGILDENYENVAPIAVTLNGTTPVVISATPLLRIHTARVTSAGSGGTNAGDITCRHTTTTSNVFFNMPAGYGQTLMMGYTIPAGHTGILRRIHGQVRGATTAAVDGNLWVRNFGEIFRSRRPFVIISGSDFVMDIHGGLVLQEKTDVIGRIIFASANNTEVVMGYDIILVKN